MRDRYVRQVRLLVRVLPYLAREEVFALKGGTAINLFHRDLPRLSVDIDLTYLPLKNRDESLAEISNALERISAGIQRAATSMQARGVVGGGGEKTRLLVRDGAAEVKVESSPVLRGVVHEPELRRVTEAVEDEYGFAEARIVSFADLFAGKIHAALDRQHPRDLFDVKILYENEGISDELFRTLLVYFASSPRPLHELLDPHPINLERSFEQNFEGMTTMPVSCEELRDTRHRLITDIRSRLDDTPKQFLLGLHDGEPDFSLLDLPGAAELPAVRWKVLNLRRLADENPSKHAEQRQALEVLFA